MIHFSPPPKPTGSNPHPALKPGAIEDLALQLQGNNSSNPHPALKPGAILEL